METKLTQKFIQSCKLDLGQPIRVRTPGIDFSDMVGLVHGYDPERKIVDLEFPKTDTSPARIARFYPFDRLNLVHS